MLAKTQRLRFGRDIDRVFRQGRYGGSQLLAVKVLNRGHRPSRAVVIVGKKVSKKAVDRNRLRRQLAEQLSGLWQQIPAGCDIVVTVQPQSLGQNSAELAKNLSAALTKAGVIKGKNV